jgi:predicted lipid-binding transport protein (Tim44 family)
MRFTILAFVGAVVAAPVAQLDLGALLGSLGGGAGGLDLNALAGQFLGSGTGPVGDVNVIITQYGNIKEKVEAQDTFIKTLVDKAPADLIAKLEKFGADQVEALKAAAKAVDGMVGAVDLMGATGLQAPGGDLTISTQTSIDNLKKAAPIIVKVAGAKDAELKTLNAMLEATKAFNDAVNKKLPAFAVAIAQGEGQKSVDYLTDAISAFTKT